MTKVSSGVFTGLVLGGIYGAIISWGVQGPLAIFTTILGRASQGIINGLLAAYAMKGRRSVWLGALLGGLIGVGLGGLAGIPAGNWMVSVPYGGAVGIGCGLAVARPTR
jgi:hypothetical protein